LRKIDAATQVGVNLTTYNELLIEAKVNEADRTLPDGDLKTDLDIAIWRARRRNPRISLGNSQRIFEAHIGCFV
jgi:hypothetical protein